MYTPLISPVEVLTLPETKLNYPIIRFFHGIIQPYARALHFKEPVMLHANRMIDAYHSFFEKKTRLILGFRHAYGDDPHIISYALHHALPVAGKKAGKPFKQLTHAHFLYGAEVPLWSGNFVRWLLPNVGAVPINHIHMDSSGMNRIRKIIADGAFPLALAPEGHATYVSEKVGELETGTARFGFWCIEDLAKQGRNEQVVFLPVSHHYRYGKNAAKFLSRFLHDIEKQCGISTGQKSYTEKEIPSRLRRIGETLLALLIEFYSEMNLAMTEHTQSDVLDAMLRAAERMFSLKGVGDTANRIYKIREIAWKRVYRDDIKGMSPLRKVLAGRETAEAWYAMRHMECAELLHYVDLTVIPENAHIEDYMEIAHNFYDLAERLKGGTLRNRANAIDKYAVIVPGEPVVINSYLELYKSDKKQALTKVTDDIHARFEQCIVEYRKVYP